MSTTHTVTNEITEMGAQTFRDNLASACREVMKNGPTLVTRGRNAGVAAPAYCLPESLWSTICTEYADLAPAPEQIVAAHGSRDGRAKLGPAWLHAWNDGDWRRGRHTLIKPMSIWEEWSVVICPRDWYHAALDQDGMTIPLFPTRGSVRCGNCFEGMRITKDGGAVCVWCGQQASATDLMSRTDER